ncbi:winged helix-turn-helix transcriptional regulator [Henriciella mobilis]|uniref:Transcriptional regulator n=1 Tax=Henriciella mobilis TaxID=2305467 RepID=A0A399RJ18_9PROT|nr:helix-turn-helix domain-containing protein [Henriciella mobilis]RIJ17913.1 transcriptional regulator [Henriciella mobilis]RIJ25710.1 transcriptional regulator [Henriciella mobilis]RIJ30344.1 transcriptional regulator [Henriciella mobilis]
MKWSELDENWCPVARTLTLVGDRWTLLILRDCFLGSSKFEEFAASTGATRHIISSRLKRLVDAGILERKLYVERPKRYEYLLTEKGREFAPALVTFRDWGKKHLPVRRSVIAAKG